MVRSAVDMPVNQAFALLESFGIPRADWSAETLSANVKILWRKYHPDMHAGASENEKAKLNASLSEINAAVDSLKAYYESGGKTPPKEESRWSVEEGLVQTVQKYCTTQTDRGHDVKPWGKSRPWTCYCYDGASFSQGFSIDFSVDCISVINSLLEMQPEVEAVFVTPALVKQSDNTIYLIGIRDIALGEPYPMSITGSDPEKDELFKATIDHKLEMIALRKGVWGTR